MEIIVFIILYLAIGLSMACACRRWGIPPTPIHADDVMVPGGEVVLFWPFCILMWIVIIAGIIVVVPLFCVIYGAEWVLNKVCRN